MLCTGNGAQGRQPCPHPAQCDDALGAARGVCYALPLALALWAAIIAWVLL